MSVYFVTEECLVHSVGTPWSVFIKLRKERLQNFHSFKLVLNWIVYIKEVKLSECLSLLDLGQVRNWVILELKSNSLSQIRGNRVYPLEAIFSPNLYETRSQYNISVTFDI